MRDYLEQPLKRGESIEFDDLYALYIDQNLSAKEVAEKLNITKSRVDNCVKKYGIKKDKQKIKECKERLSLKEKGYKHYFASVEGKKVVKQALLDKYGVVNAAYIVDSKEKKKNTCLERYGVENPNQNKDIQEKTKRTLKEKTGYEYAFQVPEVKEKIKQTVREKYGVENISQSEEIKHSKKETFYTNYDTEEKRKEIKEKTKQTCQERYGADSFAQSKYFDIEGMQKKRYETMKKNNSFNSSSDEKFILGLLQQKFSHVKTNHRTELYPFKCDFYIPSSDLYIEYQGHISHGDHPFNPDNKEDVEIVNSWRAHSEEINFKGEKKQSYLTFIETWTKRDPLKRKVAKENDLNWLEFFTLDEFLFWFNSK